MRATDRDKYLFNLLIFWTVPKEINLIVNLKSKLMKKLVYNKKYKRKLPGRLV